MEIQVHVSNIPAPTPTDPILLLTVNTYQVFRKTTSAIGMLNFTGIAHRFLSSYPQYYVIYSIGLATAFALN